MNIMMLSCKQASLLSSKQAFNKLSIGENLKLTMHTKICSACKSLNQDISLIDQAVQKILLQKEQQKIALTEEQRRKILDALK